MKYFFILCSLVLVVHALFAKNADEKENKAGIQAVDITKDGLYLSIGKKEGHQKGDIFTAKLKGKKAKSIFIQIQKIYDHKALACLLTETKTCSKDLKALLPLKKLTFFPQKQKKAEQKVSEASFIRMDAQAFQVNTKEELKRFHESHRVFELIIFKHDQSKKDSDYRFSGMVNLYSVGDIELNETDLNSLNNILQVDVFYEDKYQSLKGIFDTNLFLQKKNNTFNFHLYQLSYALKYKQFTLALGRDHMADLGEFTLSDGVFLSYKRKSFQAMVLASFGIDYYDKMLTDFNHIYVGFYLKNRFQFKKMHYDLAFGFIPEYFYQSLGILPVYLTNAFDYGEYFSIYYQLKASYSRLYTDKDFYFNHYIHADFKLKKDLRFSLGFDSREYPDLANYSYYESLLEQIDSDRSKNIYSTVSYSFHKDLLTATYKYRFDDQEFSVQYYNYALAPLEYSLRFTGLFTETVNLYLINTNIRSKLFFNWEGSMDILGMLEEIKELDQTVFSLIPEVSLYKKILDYFYFKGEVKFNIKAKRVSGMLKFGYIWDNKL